MELQSSESRKRLFRVWLVTVGVCGTSVGIAMLFPRHDTLTIGLDGAFWVDLLAYLSAGVMCVTTVMWFRAAPRKKKRITVRELRRRAGHSR